MKKACMILVFALAFSIALVSAQSNFIEFNQEKSDLFINQTINQSHYEAYEKGALEQTKEGYYFVRGLKFNETIKELSIFLNLDGGVSAKTSGIFPKPSRIYSNGERITLVWEYSNLAPGQDIALFVTLRENRTQSKPYWLYLLLVLILAAIAVILAYFLRRTTKELYLLDEEKRIISILKSARREGVWQKQIWLKTGYSKAKLSRLIRNLEARGMIKKIPFGNTNKIVLKARL